MDRILKPNYYEKFNCIANECEEHCCAGWRVNIDKGTFNKYRKLNNKFGIYINKHVKRNRKNTNDGDYAKIKLNEMDLCPMLDGNGMCNIQNNFGAEYLSHTCKSYPRNVSKYNDIYELSLTISCPEVARKILLNEDPILFEYSENKSSKDEKSLFKEYIKSDEDLYNLIWEIRSACIAIIQYREIEIWKRIIFIAMMCDKIQTNLDKDLVEESYLIIDDYRNRILNKNIVESLDSIDSTTNVKLPIVKSIIQERNRIGMINKMFKRICVIFDEVMDSGIDDSIDMITEKYTEIDNVYYREFIKYNEYIIENYLVYNIFNNFMRVIDTKEIYKEIVKLVINYSMIRILLTGKLAYHKEKITKQNLIEVFYSFSRTIEHNENFLNDTYEDMKKMGYDKLAYVVILIK